MWEHQHISLRKGKQTSGKVEGADGSRGLRKISCDPIGEHKGAAESNAAALFMSLIHCFIFSSELQNWYKEHTKSFKEIFIGSIFPK